MYAGRTAQSLNNFFKTHNPEYQDGYEEGYKAAREEMTAKFNKILKEMQPFHEATTTEES